MMLPLEWTHDLSASKLSKLKLSRPAGSVFAVRIEVADEHGKILGSAVGTGASVYGAIDNAELNLPEGLR